MASALSCAIERVEWSPDDPGAMFAIGANIAPAFSHVNRVADRAVGAVERLVAGAGHGDVKQLRLDLDPLISFVGWALARATSAAGNSCTQRTIFPELG